MTTSSFQVRLLGVLVAATAGGCGDDDRRTQDACYVPGAIRGETSVAMPELPCLPPSDGRLSGLVGGCIEDFEVTAGPEQKTDENGQTTCCYTVRYATIRGCVVGRPLRAGEEQRTAALAERSDWGA